ncbi:hypothetical protein IWQ62_002545 [Dispira parvispora]|uniref:Uncharacterized protein n=1 Tax=Dispira parvispora TaxID=1520584 RepID=A0A9W8AQ52_9FUNG|nr:hypothetical protein IWQ62_002545 [Dispira parvispora]
MRSLTIIALLAAVVFAHDGPHDADGNAIITDGSGAVLSTKLPSSTSGSDASATETASADNSAAGLVNSCAVVGAFAAVAAYANL